MSKGKELTKNTLIIFLGRFCTQFISFLLIPIYTRYLLTSDYGYIDLLQTYIALFVPIIILRFDSAIFRFLIDVRNNTDNQKKIVTNVFLTLLFQIAIFVLFFCVLQYFLKFNSFIYIILNAISLSISSIILQLTRGLGDNKGYAYSCVISAVITLTLTYLLIVKYHMGAVSILIVSSIANLCCSLFLIIRNRIYKLINLKLKNMSLLKKMLKYSLPMIPDGLSWWIVNASDRSIISLFLNTSANGIYAISSKFSNILASIFQVFNMSWQESASLHINEDDKEEFFSNVVSTSYKIFYSICVFIMVVLPIVYPVVVGKNYYDSYNFIPILLLGNLVNSFGNVIGGIYIATKNTKEVAKTTILGAIINVIINILCIKYIGLWAAALSTLISYLVVAIYRFIDSKKYVNITLNYKLIVLTLLLFTISLIMYFINNMYLNILNLIINIIVIIVLNKNQLKMALKLFKG